MIGARLDFFDGAGCSGAVVGATLSPPVAGDTGGFRTISDSPGAARRQPHSRSSSLWRSKAAPPPPSRCVSTTSSTVPLRLSSATDSRAATPAPGASALRKRPGAALGLGGRPSPWQRRGPSSVCLCLAPERLLARSLARAEARGHLASAALDRMAMGVVILDGEGRVAHLNPAARRRLGTDCGVTLVADRLEFVNPELEGRLRALREREHETSTEPRRLASELLRAPRAGGKPPLEIPRRLARRSRPRGGRRRPGALPLRRRPRVRNSRERPSCASTASPLPKPESPRSPARQRHRRSRDPSRPQTRNRPHPPQRRHRQSRHHPPADLVRLLLTGAAGVRWE